MVNGCPNCEALCAICQDNTYNWHEPLCSSCRLAVAYTEDRIIKLLEENLDFGLDVGICDKESNCQIDLLYLITLIKGENK